MSQYITFVSILADKEGKHSTVRVLKDKVKHYAKCEWMKDYVEVDVEEKPQVEPVRYEPPTPPQEEPKVNKIDRESYPVIAEHLQPQAEEPKRRGRKPKSN